MGAAQGLDDWVITPSSRRRLMWSRTSASWWTGRRRGAWRIGREEPVSIWCCTTSVRPTSPWPVEMQQANSSKSKDTAERSDSDKWEIKQRRNGCRIKRGCSMNEHGATGSSTHEWSGLTGQGVTVPTQVPTFKLTGFRLLFRKRQAACWEFVPEIKEYEAVTSWRSCISTRGSRIKSPGEVECQEKQVHLPGKTEQYRHGQSSGRGTQPTYGEEGQS